MLVVLVIIALLASLALPHMRGNQESVAINAACRQLVDDLSFARQRAMSIRGTVSVVFLPPDLFNYTLTSYTTNEQAAIKRLQGGVYTQYALYQYRTVGEQPGSYASAGYITGWRTLPDKTFIFPSDVQIPGAFQNNGAKFPFPFGGPVPPRSPNTSLPYVAFDSEGRSITIEREETGAGIISRDIEFRVARGAILYSRLPDGSVDSATYDVQQIPPNNATNNVIHIDGLTGRAQRIELQLQ